MKTLKRLPADTLRRVPLLLLILFFFITSRLDAEDGVASPPVVQGFVDSVATDEEGNRYITGNFEGTRDFNREAGEDVISSVGQEDLFVTRYNADGTYAWTQTFGGSLDEGGEGIHVRDGTVYVTGYVQSPDAGFGSPGQFASTGDKDVLVIALDAETGVPMLDFGTEGVVVFGGAARDQGDDVIATETKIYVAGFFESPDAGFNGAGSFSTAGFADAFVFVLNRATGAVDTGFGSSGLLQFGGSSQDRASAIDLSDDVLYVVGAIRSDNAGFNGIPGNYATSRYYDAFVMAVDAATGKPVDSFGTNALQTLGGYSNEYAYSLVVSDGAVYVTGFFSSNDMGIGGMGDIQRIGNTDVFVLALDKVTGQARTEFNEDGILIFGGTGWDEGYGITARAGTVYVAGGFWSTDAGFGQAGTISSSGHYDTFILAINQQTGQPVLDFSDDGVEIFGGSSNDYSFGLCIAATLENVVTVGFFSSVDAGVGGPGGIDSTGWDGLMLEFKSVPTLAALVVNIEPEEAVADGALWRLTDGDDTSWHSSGEEIQIPEGEYTIEFSQVDGWTAPAGISVAVASGEQASRTGVYEKEVIDLPDPPVPPEPVEVIGPVTAVAVDEAGNRYVAGYFHRFEKKRFFRRTRYVSYGNDAYAAKIAPGGEIVWTKSFGGRGDDRAAGIAVAAGTVYFTGSFERTAGFDGSRMVRAKGRQDAFAAALSAETGEPVKDFGKDGAATFGGSGREAATAVAVSERNVYISGWLSSRMVRVVGRRKVKSNGRKDAFVLALLKSNGLPNLGFGESGVKVIGGRYDDSAASLAVDKNSLYVVGSYTERGKRRRGRFWFRRGRLNQQAFVMKLDTVTGKSAEEFGENGIALFGDKSRQSAAAVAIGTENVFAAVNTFRSSFDWPEWSAAGSRTGVVALSLADGKPCETFGKKGVLKLKGSGGRKSTSVAVLNGKVILAGLFSGQLRVAGEKVRSQGRSDGFIFRLDEKSGQPVKKALVTFGDDGRDACLALAVDESFAHAAGYTKTTSLMSILRKARRRRLRFSDILRLLQPGGFVIAVPNE